MNSELLLGQLERRFMFESEATGIKKHSFELVFGFERIHHFNCLKLESWFDNYAIYNLRGTESERVLIPVQKY